MGGNSNNSNRDTRSSSNSKKEWEQAQRQKHQEEQQQKGISAKIREATDNEEKPGQRMPNPSRTESKRETQKEAKVKG